MANDGFRWRNSPAVIARYIHDRDVPKGAEVTLKPNEACVVVEDGKVAGVATQQHMEVNPKAGLISRMFGRGNPKRTFLFVFLGPHDLLLRLNTQTNDGQPAVGMLSLRVSISREQAPKLLQLPAKGQMEITAATLVTALENEIQAHLNPIIKNHTLESLRTAETTDDLLAELRVSLRKTVGSIGLTLDNSYVNWNQTEAEELLKMRTDLENLVERNVILDESESSEMERILSQNLRRAELEARSRMVGLAAEERAKVELELAKVRASGELEMSRWSELNALHSAQHDARRGQQLKDAEHDVELARLQVERDQLVHSAEDQRSSAKRKEKTEAAKDLFAEVQARKRERMALEEGREKSRLDATREGSDKAIDTLAEIASSSDDSEVAKEALRQLGNLRQSDVDAEGQAYIDKDDQ